MDQTRITFVINSNTYSLSSADSKAIRAIPEDDRRELIRLLEAVRQEEETAQAKAREADARARALLNGSGQVLDSRVQHTPSPDRLGVGDADALMARLVMEEKMTRKPGLTKQGLYKLVFGIFVAICLLVLLF